MDSETVLKKDFYTNFMDGIRSVLNVAGEEIDVKLGDASDDANAMIEDWNEVGNYLQEGRDAIGKQII